MSKASAEEREKLLEEIKRSTGGQRISDLDRVAKAFGCAISAKKSGHIFYVPPFKEIQIVNVAPPKSDTVLKKYVSRFITMCEEILARESEEGK